MEFADLWQTVDAPGCNASFVFNPFSHMRFPQDPGVNSSTSTGNKKMARQISETGRMVNKTALVSAGSILWRPEQLITFGFRPPHRRHPRARGAARNPPTTPRNPPQPAATLATPLAPRNPRNPSHLLHPPTPPCTPARVELPAASLASPASAFCLLWNMPWRGATPLECRCMQLRPVLGPQIAWVADCGPDGKQTSQYPYAGLGQ